ncbi:polysaccharide deacetylase family protein [Bacillus sp. FJAT-45066]|uniref:polysaccharide deacetylase family protein n=1 Tax=Bacillus sp. FJAT-45066 TaxID=2011010 RepID=UPI000BB7475F|nr:polysaccharide deacetylase family protein [Bacillus sp. FJAT-45066]
MRKWMLSLLLLILLAACSTNNLEDNVQANENENNLEEKKEEVDKEPKEENVKEEDRNVKEEERNVKEEDRVIKDEPIVEIEPEYYLDKDWGLKPIGDANPDVVLLTIDDAPDRYALEMANTLKQLNVKAIFFVNGHFIDTVEEQQVLKEIFNMGFEIGNHTMTHKSLRNLSEEEQYTEIIGLNDLIEEVLGERPKFFRAPFGQNTEYASRLVEEEGMLLMNWTYGYDWEIDYKTKDTLTDIMVNTPLLTSGANLLMHDREWTYEALEGIVIGLQEKGYEILDPKLIRIYGNN